MRKQESGEYRSVFVTALGSGAVVASSEGLVEVFLPFAGYSPAEMLERVGGSYPSAVRENHLTMKAAGLLRRYFTGEKVTFELAIDLRGFTSFQQTVYTEVSKIPYGMVKTYGEVAGAIGRQRAARGVGTAMARNPLPIIIPCHRVVGGSGDMTGYSGTGGVVSKRLLLTMEGVVLDDRGRVKQGSL